MSYNRIWRSREDLNLQSFAGYPRSRRADYHYRTAALAAAAGFEPTTPWVRTRYYSNGAMPLYGPRQSKEALPGQIGEKRRTTWPAFAGGDSGGRRTPKPEDHRCSGPAGIATCHRCHIGNRGPHVPYSIYIICTSSNLYFREQARVFLTKKS